MRRGFTMIEIGMVLVITGILLGLAAPRFARIRDGIAVRNAIGEVVSILSVARHTAIMRGGRVGVKFERNSGRVLLLAGRDTFERRDLRTLYGVSLAPSRDSTAYGPLGHGYGAANLRVVIRRGAAGDTLFISRLGRVRH